MGIKELREMSTTSTLFLVRAIGLDPQVLKKRCGFIDAYIDDIDHDPHYENSVYLLFKPHDMDEMRNFIQDEPKRTDNLIEEYDYPEGYLVIVYAFPKNLLNDYQLFMTGQYSKFSNRFKSLFPMVEPVKTLVGGPSRDSLYNKIFNKQKDLRKWWEKELGVELDEDMEVWGAPDIKGREILNIKKFI